MENARKKQGFTIIELTVAVGLMVVLIAIITVIFHQANTIFTLIKARLQIYQSARISIDCLSKDFSSFMPPSSGKQRFSIMNGSKSSEQNDVDQARDQIAFRSFSVNEGNVIVPVEVHYLLIAENDPTFMNEGNSGNTTTIRNEREIYVLRRIVRRIDDEKGFLKGEVLELSDLCYYTMSFNVEILYENSEKNLTPTYLNILSLPSQYRNESSLESGVYPLGDAPMGESAAEGNAEPEIPRAVRLTLRIIDSAAERQERVFIKVFKTY